MSVVDKPNVGTVGHIDQGDTTLAHAIFGILKNSVAAKPEDLIDYTPSPCIEETINTARKPSNFKKRRQKAKAAKKARKLNRGK